jgi:hypothetical protein
MRRTGCPAVRVTRPPVPPVGKLFPLYCPSIGAQPVTGASGKNLPAARSNLAISRPQPPGRVPGTNPNEENRPYLITALIAIVAVKIVYPMVQPMLAKLPVVGNWFMA